MLGDTSPDRPALFWDADCGFCRRWIERWHQTTGDAVDYLPLQQAPAEVVSAAGGPPFQRIVLRQPDGSLFTGARAAITALATRSAAAAWLLAAISKIPFLGPASEFAYRLVAANRAAASALTNLLWGPSTLAPTYEISGWLFPRLVGLVFMAAFISLWVQIDGLAGSRGILPVAEHLEAVRQHFSESPAQAWWQFPTLLWFGSGDRALHLWLALGFLASLALALGRWPAASAFTAWLCYLAFAAALPVFLNFQWDALLLEAGLLAVLFVPWQAALLRGRAEPARLGRLLVWWLLFRLMFESGIVKLYGFDATGRNAWLEGTALDYHYFTQPIPVWVSWWLAQLPSWFHWLSLALVFVIELVLPFFILGPRRLRMIAFWGFTLLMLLIMASGHYGFFNLLTLALAISLIDDASWPDAFRNFFRPAPPPSTNNRMETIHRRLLPWAATILFAVTALQLLLVLRLLSPATIAPILAPVAPLRSANSYGLFSVMTTERPEIFIESSADGLQWEPWIFRWKMDTASTSMPFLIPHMPRLDWQMWFAALEYQSSGQPPSWILPFLARMQEKSTPVADLLKTGPDNPPKFFRLRLDLLKFSSPETRRETGRYWQSTPLPGHTIEGELQQPSR